MSGKPPSTRLVVGISVAKPAEIFLKALNQDPHDTMALRKLGEHWTAAALSAPVPGR
jgi:hypothetical protein